MPDQPVTSAAATSLAAAPLAPCQRRNPHTNHMTADGECLGSASEFPWEETEVVPDV
jgi:hypothetical protein